MLKHTLIYIFLRNTVLLAIFTIGASALGFKNSLSEAAGLTKFSINNVPGVISGNNISVTLAYNTNLSLLAASFTLAELPVLTDSVTVNGIVQTSGVSVNDFSNSLVYVAHDVLGGTSSYTVTVSIANPVFSMPYAIKLTSDGNSAFIADNGSGTLISCAAGNGRRIGAWLLE